MKRTYPAAVLAACLVLEGIAPCFSAETVEGVALAIVYDTSGSMRDPVKDAQGRQSPKFEIANRALLALARQVQEFATNRSDGTARAIQAALFTFQGEGAKAVVPMSPFDPAAFTRFAQSFRNPNGNTPLGNALAAAAQAVFRSPLSRKHVLVITDGINTAGPQPAAVLPRLKKEAERRQFPFSVHFIAFDVDAGVFGPVKAMGATVVSAADERQLNKQLDFILETKILLEDEDPKPGRESRQSANP